MNSPRSTADKRREQAVAVGMRVFAENGFSTSALQRIADEIGVSQPYVFRLFGSKQALLLACLDELEARVRHVFLDRASQVPGMPLRAMGNGFRELVADGVVSGLWLQACTVARGNEEVAARCRSILVNSLEEAARATGAGQDELTQFLADGALVMLLQALNVDLTGGTRAAVSSMRTEGISS